MTRFTTRLQSAVDLDGQWEVGLSEIIFPRSWVTLDEKEAYFKMICAPCDVVEKYIEDEDAPETELNVTIPMKHGHYNSIDDIVAEINAGINRSVKLEPQPEGGYQHLAYDFAERLQETGSTLWRAGGARRLHPKLWPKLEYDGEKRKVKVTIPRYMELEFSPLLADILGFSKSRNPIVNDSNNEEIFHSDHACDIHAGINSVYVYCDVLEHVPVGDTKAPLLRIANAIGEDIIHNIYETPKFLPLLRKQFDSIEIDLRDCYGEPIPFDGGESVVVILEFRRAQNPYFL